MKARHRKILERILARPTSANIRWSEVESLLRAVGAEIEEREGSRVAVIFGDEVHIFHRPHPSPMTDKGAAAAVRKLLQRRGVTP